LAQGGDGGRGLRGGLRRRERGEGEQKKDDKNFGLTFSLWDHLFGTQYRNYDEYPDTGINDEDFPFEQDPRSLGYLGSLFGQFLYPFRAILRHQG
jgi:hypothetical protein